MIHEMIELSGIDTGGYIMIIPQASEEPDTAAYYARRQFESLGDYKYRVLSIENDSIIRAGQVEDVRNAALIYITGGVQTKLMEIIGNSPVHEAIIEAYNNGATIAGTSAGAAVMSKLMLTGNEFKHPEYTGDFRTIEADNMEIVEGLGLLENAIIDQHFIRRMRMNRLISVALEHPGYKCIGIDESTAIIVHQGRALVTGESQVIMLENPATARVNDAGLLAGTGLILDVYYAGDTIQNVY
jgi:cyanophycinase